jgi:hypothetical protein
LRLLFPSHPLSPPTDHEILGKTEPTAQKFFGGKKLGKQNADSAANNWFYSKAYRGLTPFLAMRRTPSIT